MEARIFFSLTGGDAALNADRNIHVVKFNAQGADSPDGPPDDGLQKDQNGTVYYVLQAVELADIVTGRHVFEK